MFSGGWSCYTVALIVLLVGSDPTCAYQCHLLGQLVVRIVGDDDNNKNKSIPVSPPADETHMADGGNEFNVGQSTGSY